MHRLDPLFDEKHDFFYHKAREELFPKTVRGSVNNANRAGDKIEEIFRVSFLDLKDVDQLRFADVCAAPGAWSIFLLKNFQNAKGVGMSMPVQGTKLENTWYPELQKNPRFYATFGKDKTGNVYIPENLNQLQHDCKEFLGTDQLDIVTCDGGFQIPKDPQGNHCEQLQEGITQRLLFAEFTLALMLLKTGGSFVCKMYDSIETFTVQLLFLMQSCFNKFSIVKPEHSRIMNAERYLVFQDLKCNVAEVKDLFIKMHASWKSDECYDKFFESCTGFDGFNDFIKNVNETLIVRATKALNLVVDRAEFMLKNPNYNNEGNQQNQQYHNQQNFGQQRVNIITNRNLEYGSYQRRDRDRGNQNFEYGSFTRNDRYQK